ncbi:Uma2 family endonuclease [Streptomyces sp. NPDC086023]|uniref:Uma2 family endonuclease n=1 Tax=Streptomyces sp. NPDC086023 TaxID=3365746 RepID=UPI0037D57D63
MTEPVSPGPELRFFRPMRELRRQLQPHAPTGHVAESAPVLFSFPATRSAQGPDLYVADLAAFEREGRHADAGALSLVAEFTSVAKRGPDKSERLDAYGRLVPVCLVVEMPGARRDQGSEITCLSGPSPNGYRSRTAVSFWAPLRIPEPFGFELDTSTFAAAGS